MEEERVETGRNNDTAPRQAGELEDLFSDQGAPHPFLDLYIASRNGDIDSVTQHFKAWWQSFSLCTLQALRTKHIEREESSEAALYWPQIIQLQTMHVPAHPPATFKYNPLHIAAAHGKLEALEKLIELISERSGKKREHTALAYSLSITNPAEAPPVTALDFACKYNHPHIIKRLLQAGADPGTTRPRKIGLNNMTPLMWCILNEANIELIKDFIKALPSNLRREYLNASVPETRINALQLAIDKHNVLAVRELLLNGASASPLQAQDQGANTPGIESKEDLEAQRNIDQLLLIFSQNNDNSESARRPSGPRVSAIPTDLAVKSPGFHLCRVACRLIDRADNYSQQGDDKPALFLRRLLESLPKKSLLVERFVLSELGREEPGWFKTQYKAALNNKNFYYYFLQELAQHTDFLNCLKMNPWDYTQFSGKDSVRVAFLDQLSRELSAHIAKSTSFATAPRPQMPSIK